MVILAWARANEFYEVLKLYIWFFLYKSQTGLVCISKSLISNGYVILRESCLNKSDLVNMIQIGPESSQLLRV